MVNASQTALPEPSLLDISRFETPSLHFKQSQTITTTTERDTSINIKDLIDDRSTEFLQLYFHNWQQDGLFSTLKSWSDVRNGEPLQQPTVIPLHILRFAQEIQFRLVQIGQYLQLVKRMHQLKIERKKAPNARLQKGQRVDSLASILLLKELYQDWDTVDEKLQADRRLRFRKQNREARKWLLAASRLSFGFLVICGKTLENQLTKHTTESQVLSAAARIAKDFPMVVETYCQLDVAVKGLLNHEKGDILFDLEPTIARIAAQFHPAAEISSSQSDSIQLAATPHKSDGLQGLAILGSDHAVAAMEEILESHKDSQNKETYDLKGVSSS
ncbi:uncharacterized protein BDW70DRAFT_164826 [Aspergillus foveolatus]|uniref:uncharacterized protein n=1 Tax=Aspergillus foveolatus TaxID=210207 RepID=UPI003CCD55FE